jgi:YgiT-type zinc finger domain-containing protein
MTTDHDEPQASLACPHCQAGNLRLKRVVYARWYGRHFVTIPNFPSWVCDVCGGLEYDQAALEQVRLVLGREGATPAEAARPASPSPAPFASQPRSTTRRPI